ncbi:MAG: hypothetical protein HYZ85_01980 [Candidatus Omnitrophica bacterium]|nr:hypothetical protein [Candidatus Omnitrophota bacterium]
MVGGQADHGVASFSCLKGYAFFILSQLPDHNFRSYLFDNMRVVVLGGQIVSSTRREYGLLGLAGENQGKITWGLLDTDDPTQMLVGIDITQGFTDGQSQIDFSLQLDDTQKSLLNSYDFDYPFAAEAFAADIEQNPQQHTTSGENLINLLNRDAGVVYERLTEAEKSFVKNPLNLPLIQKFRDDAVLAANIAADIYKFGDPQALHNGRGDAFRHALWSALMAKSGGATKALEYSNAHEEDPLQPLAEREMDLHNNTVGISIVQENPNADLAELTSIILEKIDDGELEWLNGD